VYGGASRAPSRETLLAMAGELRHRGPDGAGLYVDRRFAMANTRLAIVDVEGGDQPLSDESGRYWVMQNGEIYNHPELRLELQRLGHRFTTRCDTEVIVHAYEEWGADCLQRLNGEFAIAVWDRATEQLFLARDRFGIRPLFLSWDAGTLSFASEAKALFRRPGAQRELDPLGVVESFTLWATSPRRSAFTGVSELAPGHYMRVGPDGAVEERCWWQLPLAPRSEWRRESEADLAEELDCLLDDATRIRLRADVAVGTYLSGGVDSSAITALAQRSVRKPLRAFGVRFADPHFDEAPFQDRVALHLGTDLSTVTVGAADIAALLPRVVELAEKPTLRTAPAPLLRLSEAVRAAGIKVVLTGEGADEIFGGYDVFKLDAVRRFWARHPESKCRPRLLARLYPYLAHDVGRGGTVLHNVFSVGLTDVEDPLYSHRPRFDQAGRSLARFFGRDFAAVARARGDATAELIERLPPEFDGYSALGRAQHVEVSTFLSGYLLHTQGDRMLMGNSIEGRFPFLDHRLAEFAGRLPDGMKLRGLREKHLLRRAVRSHLPPEITRREKRPYRAPILRAFVGPDTPEWVSELTSPECVREANVFDPAAVEWLMRKCRRNVDAGVSEMDEMALVGVLSTMLLRAQLVARAGSAAPVVPGRVVVGSTVESGDARAFSSARVHADA
jgi:asparagine synthase (glutamine-hydrolysing)